MDSKIDNLCTECFEEIMEEKHKKAVNAFEHHYLTDNLIETEIDELYIENANGIINSLISN